VHAPIDFYFDFSSPYGYFAAEVIEDLAGKYGRSVLWHPILLGVSIKTTGQASLSSIPMKGEYSVRDFARSARFLKLPYNHPKTFPIATQHAARAFLWANDRDPLHARRLAQDIYRAYFVDKRNIGDPEVLLDIVKSVGLPAEEARTVLEERRFREAVDTDWAKSHQYGVTGVPTFVAGGYGVVGAQSYEVLEQLVQKAGAARR